MNTKLRNDSTFAQLTSEQIEMLEDWLFEDKLAYKEVVAKMQQEMGIKTSQTALGRFFRRLANDRAEEVQMETMAACLATLANAKGDGTLQAGLFALANIQAAQLLLKPMSSVKEFTGLLRAMTSAQAQEMKRVQAQRAEEKQRQFEQAEKEREEREAEERKEKLRELNAGLAAEHEQYEARRKARLAKKEAKAKAEAMQNDQLQMPNDKVEKAAVIIELASRANKTNQPSEGGTPSAEPAVEPAGGLTLLEQGRDFTINRAGNTP